MKVWSLVLVVALALTGVSAEAGKRMGGGKSVGKQSTNVTQQNSTSPPAASPAQSATAASNKPVSSAATAAAAPKRPWGAMLGGLAAGLGLAWLASSLGLGEGFGDILMIALFAIAAFMAFKWFMRRRTQASSAQFAAPFAFQGASNVPLANPKPYRVENVGNDASARPWERNSMAFEAPKPLSASVIGSALAGKQGWGIPEGFDTEGFLLAAKTNFVALQAAWDRSDIPSLRVMMTDGMLQEIQSQLGERESHTGGSTNTTDVIMVEAHLLGIEELPEEYMASVEFSGMIREDASAGPSPFREVWNMTKSKTGSSGWLVAGVQALQ